MIRKFFVDEVESLYAIDDPFCCCQIRVATHLDENIGHTVRRQLLQNERINLRFILQNILRKRGRWPD